MFQIATDNNRYIENISLMTNGSIEVVAILYANGCLAVLIEVVRKKNV